MREKSGAAPRISLRGERGLLSGKQLVTTVLHDLGKWRAGRGQFRIGEKRNQSRRKLRPPGKTLNFVKEERVPWLSGRKIRQDKKGRRYDALR